MLACTYQAISGAGKTFETWPEMVDNLIPYIGGEEQKSEEEPLKIWGTVQDGLIVNAAAPSITTQCLRVPVTNGHMAAVFASFDRKPDLEEIKAIWAAYRGRPQEAGAALCAQAVPVPTSRSRTIPRRGCTAIWRAAWPSPSAASAPTPSTTCKFVCLSHNTLRGAAGGGVLPAELLCAEGYITAQ